MFSAFTSTKWWIAGFIIALFWIIAVSAGTKGKIAGRILDAQTNEPLAGANVIISETVLGATSDQDGNYFIINIPPGKYQIEAMYIGYATLIVKDVKVSVDQTTQINFQMK